MESSVEVGNFEEKLLAVIESGSNCILIGESHNECPALLPLINFLLNNPELCSSRQIAIFYEDYPAFSTDIPRELHENEIANYENNKAILALLPRLLAQVKIFGLETDETDPFIEYKAKTFRENSESLSQLKALLRDKLSLLDEFQTTFGCTLEDFYTANEFTATWGFAASLFSNRAQRITHPNQIFCEFIEQIPVDTLCIAIVGNAHLPVVRKKSSGDLIDIGMEKRLEVLKRTQKPFATTLMFESEYAGEAYHVIEADYDFDNIKNVSLVSVPKLEKKNASANNNNETSSLQNNPATMFQPKPPSQPTSEKLEAVHEESEDHSNIPDPSAQQIRARSCCLFCRCCK